MDYDKKVVFITGGSSGIGLALAKEFAKRGAHLLLIARREQPLAEAKEQLRRLVKSSAQRIESVSLDVAKHEVVAKELSKWIKQLGVPDVVVNNAGFATPARFEEISYEDFRSVMDVNLGGTWNVLQAVVPEMKKRRSGQILNVSSVAGFVGVYGYTSYGASKSAVAHLSAALRSELKPHNVSVHVLFPPNTETPGFEEENKHKPAETHAIEAGDPILQPEQVARIAIKGLERGRFAIMAPYSSFIRFVNGVLPRLVHAVTDGSVRKAQKHQSKSA